MDADLRAEALALCKEVDRVFGGCLTAPMGIVQLARALAARLAEPVAPTMTDLMVPPESIGPEYGGAPAPAPNEEVLAVKELPR